MEVEILVNGKFLNNKNTQVQTSIGLLKSSQPHMLTKNTSTKQIVKLNMKFNFYKIN